MNPTSKVYSFPSSLSSSIDGYNFLANLVTQLLNEKYEVVFFDFSYCTYFETNLCAVLGSAFHEANTINTKFYITNVDDELKKRLKNNGFLQLSEGETVIKDAEQVSYSRFRINDEEAIMNYVEKELLSKEGLPILTFDLQREIVRYVMEIYSNGITHGGCHYVYSCGQVITRLNTNTSELHFSLVDIGRTIKRNVNEYTKSDMSGYETISWATTGFNTTKTEQSGGLGLKLLKEFIKNNRGSIQIISAEGFWQYSNQGVLSKNMDYSFPGTIINIVFNLKDNKLHYLDMEMPAVSEIF